MAEDEFVHMAGAAEAREHAHRQDFIKRMTEKLQRKEQRARLLTRLNRAP